MKRIAPFCPFLTLILTFYKLLKLRNLAIICSTTQQVWGMGLFLIWCHKRLRWLFLSCALMERQWTVYLRLACVKLDSAALWGYLWFCWFPFYLYLLPSDELLVHCTLLPSRTQNSNFIPSSEERDCQSEVPCQYNNPSPIVLYYNITYSISSFHSCCCCCFCSFDVVSVECFPVPFSAPCHQGSPVLAWNSKESNWSEKECKKQRRRGPLWYIATHYSTTRSIATFTCYLSLWWPGVT